MTSSEASGPKLITLMTDFGCGDPFVGQMKGVILSINPSASLIDITHDVEPHDIRGGAFVIGSSFSYFPKGTTHLSVVDPGVGSRRRALVLEAEGHRFVGPDNGLFSEVLAHTKSWRAFHLTDDRYFLALGSPTFQGRDLFAPVAARLSLGLDPSAFGPPVNDPVRIPLSEPVVQADRVTGEVIWIDRFGNAFTSIRAEHAAGLGGPQVVRVRGRDIRQAQCYHEGEEGVLSWLINSSGFLELFVRQADASRLFGLARGEAVELRAAMTELHGPTPQ